MTTEDWRDDVRGYPAKAFGLSLVAYAFSQMDLALFGYAVPSIRAELGLSLEAMGWVFSLSFAMGGIILVGLATLTDRLGRLRMLQFSIVSSSLFITATALVPGAILLTLCRGLGVATGGLLYPVTGAIVAEEAPARFRGIFTGLLQTGYPLGWFVASLMAAPILATWGWRPVFLIGLISIPFVFVVRRHLREPPRFEAAQPEKGGAKVTRDKIAALFAPGIRRRTMTLFIAQLLFVIAYGGSVFLFPTYLNEGRGLPIDTAVLIVGSGKFIGIIGYVAAAVVGEFVLTRRDTVVIWTMLGAGAFLWLVWGTSGLYDTVAAFAVMSTFFYGTAAVKFAYVAEVFPTAIRATGIAVASSLAVTLGTAVGPVTVAYAVGVWGWQTAFTAVVALPLILAGLCYLALKPVESGIEIEEVDRRLRESEA